MNLNVASGPLGPAAERQGDGLTCSEGVQSDFYPTKRTPVTPIVHLTNKKPPVVSHRRSRFFEMRVFVA